MVSTVVVEATGGPGGTATISSTTVGVSMTVIDVIEDDGQFATGPSPAWVASTAQIVGSAVVHSSNMYQCTTAGTTGSTGPTGTGGSISDGTVVWKWLSADSASQDFTYQVTYNLVVEGDCTSITNALLVAVVLGR